MGRDENGVSENAVPLKYILPEGDGRRSIQDYNHRVANHPKLISNIIPVGGWLAVSLVLV